MPESLKQKNLLVETIELHRQLYNKALQERFGAYNPGKSLNYYDQAKSLSVVKKENPEYKNPDLLPIIPVDFEED